MEVAIGLRLRCKHLSIRPWLVRNEFLQERLTASSVIIAEYVRVVAGINLTDKARYGRRQFKTGASLLVRGM
jgi:hypothetical protein